jgi:hypothetical protein
MRAGLSLLVFLMLAVPASADVKPDITDPSGAAGLVAAAVLGGIAAVLYFRWRRK